MTAHGTPGGAAVMAADRVAAVEDDPAGRLALLDDLYAAGENHLPFRRAAYAFMSWQVRRGLLNPPTSAQPGSPWWRAVNARLLRDTAEARALTGTGEAPTSDSVRAMLAFIERPTARRWYRAHNHSIVSAYLDHEELASAESRVERFFINLALVRVLYAHALVAAPRLALGALGPIAPPLGDPRLGMTAIFLSLSRVVPATYPLGDDVDAFIEAEHGFGHLLDVGVIQPRAARLYDWSASELGIPRMRELVSDDVPVYAWDRSDREPWDPRASRFAQVARRLIR